MYNVLRCAYQCLNDILYIILHMVVMCGMLFQVADDLRNKPSGRFGVFGSTDTRFVVPTPLTTVPGPGIDKRGRYKK